MLQFQHKEYFRLFGALLVLVLLFFAYWQWKRRIKRSMGEENRINRMIRGYSNRLFLLKFILPALAFAAGVLAIMNPRRPGGGEAIKRKGIDLAIALDVSKSMWAADLAPSRLERAKQFITKLMSEMPDDRIALILFAGKAYLQMPLTSDHGAAQLFVSAAGPDAVPQQGTDISEALQMSARAFISAEKRFKTVILVSDGEEQQDNAVHTAKDLAGQGVMINSIGIGSPEGAVIPDPLTGENKKDEAGNTVLSKLNEDVLRSVAEKTNGIYLRLQNNEEAVAAVKAQLAQIDRKAYGDVSLLNYRTYYLWLAAAMFLLLAADLLIPESYKALKPVAG